jgi:hypothetical protein
VQTFGLSEVVCTTMRRGPGSCARR